MIQILFNYNGDINLVKEEFNIEFYKVLECIDGTYICLVEQADDFDVIDDFMNDNGKCEVVSGFDMQGKQYSAKKTKNKYKKNKYKKYLRDKWNYDDEGNKTTKVDKYSWQVMKFLGYPNDREV